MALISDVKKLFFSLKALAHSATAKVRAQTREIGKQIPIRDYLSAQKSPPMREEQPKRTDEQPKKSVEELLAQARQRAAKLKAELEQKNKPLIDEAQQHVKPLTDRAKDAAEVVGEELLKTTAPVVDKAKNMAEDVGEKLLETGEETMKKVEETVEQVGELVLDKASQWLEKTKHLAEELGEKVLKKKNELAEQAAREMGQNPDELESLSELAKRKAEDLMRKLSGREKSEFADSPHDTGPSTLEGKDDFFAKAEKFALGQPYSDAPRIEKDPTYNKPKEKKGKVKGFEDLDGDGDELIDDALIEED